MVEPTASGRGSCALTVALAGIVVIGGVIWLLVGVWRVSQDVPIREALTFTACGQPYDLRPGYSAFDYGSRANAEVPVGQTIYNVRSTEPGIPPPDSAGDIFEAWPAEISNLVLGDPYREWLDAFGSGGVETQGTSSRLGLVEYDDGCVVDLWLDSTTEATLPRSGDWSLSLLESRPEPSGD